MIGKRKRDTSVVSRSTTKEEQEQDTSVPTTPTEVSHDLFRKFFESQFEPLDIGPKIPRKGESEKEEEGDDNEEEELEAESEWDGLSGEDEVEVIEHQDSSIKKSDLLDKKARKAFMNAKPPSFDVDTTKTGTKPTKDSGEDEEDKATDATNLKNDLALQRLLKESHLLDSASELAPTGKNRHKALDMRMQSLGANASLYDQKMPSAHRRGIKTKAATKEDKRRREAKENGIILEKPASKKQTSNKRRERGVGGPSVGKFTGGTLNLSQRDINSITRRSKGSKGRR
ncbi:uncharacterized protein EURHEDRAFT_460161 [Aspergillus ruber CBS 135680]|uniref:Uncharacterized protein n=1 Tax=Aspergillus ruber (strain CBS 135680) TaxID=1388766 RepID=A0A017S908_ASPRC|nr:uncharacterized protein EURHEDRAFT_460161 [Aspergillus ruber CBS 135680]EYE93442.1 hypothetical protein EURHEDRAFT_460161 [Aspergillus ruber CBS 135680]